MQINLPAYFISDLPPDAELTPQMLTEACVALKRNRAKYLAGRPTQSLVELLSTTGANWLRREDPFRKLALEIGPAETGFSAGTLARGLDQFFRQFTPEQFNNLIVQDLGHERRLDQIAATSGEQLHARAATARAPELMVHITAGNVPSAAMMSMTHGILLRSAQVVKCATGAALLPRLFAHSLYAADPKLGACLEIAMWRGGNEVLECALFSEADCITATGTDKTLSAIRTRVPVTTRFVGYGHRVSFAFIAEGALAGFEARAVAARAASDVAAWNQLGCLSPHVFYVQRGGTVAGDQFAALLAEELAKLEENEPRGPLPAETAATIASRRAIYDVRAAHSPDTKQWKSDNSTAWTVVFEADPLFQLSCLHRFVYVKEVPDLKTALEGAEPVRGKVSTVGLAAPKVRQPELALQLAHWGVTRVCPLGRMQDPPLTWRHDGRPTLGDLVTWTDWERED